jgi:hypothetical protein
MSKKADSYFSYQRGIGVTTEVISQRLLECIAHAERRLNRTPRVRRAIRKQAKLAAKGKR